MRCIYSVLSGILVVSTLLPYNSHSQNISQLSSPDGAIARLGNGRITGSAVYSPMESDSRSPAVLESGYMMPVLVMR